MKLHFTDKDIRELYHTYSSGKVKLIMFDILTLGYTRTERLAKAKDVSFFELEDWLRDSKKHRIKFILA